MKLKTVFQNFFWAVIFIAVGATISLLSLVEKLREDTKPAIDNKTFESNLLKIIPYHYEIVYGREGIHITVSNAGVKGQMGRVCKSGYKLRDPECVGAISLKYLNTLTPYFSYVYIKIPNAPQLNNWYKVVDESTMESGFEIYINNPNQLVIGGAWKGSITAIKWKIKNH